MSERLAGHLLFAEGYRSIDPSHPLGGPDQGADAMCVKDGKRWVMASYFAYGPHPFAEIKVKLETDIDAARHRGPYGVAFVTNQKLTNGEKDKLRAVGGSIAVDVFHLERNVHLLDGPAMSQIREQYIYIPATGLPPMSVKASVVGSAHAFTDDCEVLDRFVWMREKQIRERSDAGHARVRAESEAKERAAQERRAQEEAERARAARERPWDIGAQIPRISDLIGQSPLFGQMLPKAVEPQSLVSHRLLGIERPKPPEPLSDEEIQERADVYRAELEARWPACRDYLAATAWPALRLHIDNQAESFLNDVQIIMTFHGARGVEYEGMDSFRFERVSDPEWQPPSDPRFGLVASPILRPARRDDYPVEWRNNEDGDLEVTINLARLRPHPVWRSESAGHDVVVVVDRAADVDEITVTYTVTAQGYGKEFVGDPFAVPVEKVDMLDVLRNALKVTKDAS
ncbi:hypothetical protein [Mycolicibacter algericus]|uniref:hypothetical protein n=1 Tax=Mycolicibacter algericus TaxID=1288388 RepID=UPI003C76E35B